MLCNNLLLLAPPRAELTPIRARGAGWGHHGCMVTTRQVAPLTTCLAHSEEISGVMEAEGDMDVRQILWSLRFAHVSVANDGTAG